MITLEDTTHRERIARARGGDPLEVDALTRSVAERVYPYFRRVTLDMQRAEDLTQDTVLAVLKSLGEFRQIDRFWPWVFIIANNLIRQQFRSQSRHRTISMSTLDPTDLLGASHQDDGLAVSSDRELAALTQQAMLRVNERYRMILSLRFYEDLSHAEIAHVMGCSEFNARALFFRAKLAIMRELRSLGVGRAALMAALMAFGKLTLHPASASAATVGVSSAAVTEGLLAGVLTAKVKVAAVILAVASVAATWAILGGWGHVTSANTFLPRPQTTSLVPPSLSLPHMPQKLGVSPLYVRVINHGEYLGAPQSGEGPVKITIYFPEGANGPHLERVEPASARSDRGDTQLQTADTNYHIYAKQKEVHIQNRRWYCHSQHTAILPTDSEEFCQFVHSVDGEQSHALVKKQDYSFERDPVTGFVIAGLDLRTKGAPYGFTLGFSASIEGDPFKFVPPAGMKLIDERDEMHKRGWTLFRVAGELNGQPIRGVGRIPFTYAASLTHPAWLRLRMADRFEVVDDARRAVVQDGAGNVLFTCSGGTFLKGLSRPWEGFHTLDTIRRDAAASRSRFRTRGAGDGSAIVEVECNPDVVSKEGTDGLAEYNVDIRNDLLRSVRFWSGSEVRPSSEIQFTYSDRVEDAGREFIAPEPGEKVAGKPFLGGTPLWPMQLARELEFERRRPPTEHPDLSSLKDR